MQTQIYEARVAIRRALNAGRLDAEVRKGLEKALKDLPIVDATDEDDGKYVAAAEEKWVEEGECEIDNDPIVSVSDDGGAYVQAWVWVTDKDAGVNRDEG